MCLSHLANSSIGRRQLGDGHNDTASVYLQETLKKGKKGKPKERETTAQKRVSKTTSHANLVTCMESSELQKLTGILDSSSAWKRVLWINHTDWQSPISDTKASVSLTWKEVLCLISSLDDPTLILGETWQKGQFHLTPDPNNPILPQPTHLTESQVAQH